MCSACYDDNAGRAQRQELSRTRLQVDAGLIPASSLWRPPDKTQHEDWGIVSFSYTFRYF